MMTRESSIGKGKGAVELNGKRPRIQEKPTRQFSAVQRELKKRAETGLHREYSAKTALPPEQSRHAFVVERPPEHSTAQRGSNPVDQPPPKMGPLLQEDPLKTIKVIYILTLHN